MWGRGELQNSFERQRELAEELKDALEAEKEPAALKSRFVSMASHEFRTPLSMIMSSADMITRYGDRMDAEQHAERLEKILLIGRADANHLEFDSARIDGRECRNPPHQLHRCRGSDSRCRREACSTGVDQSSLQRY